MSEAEPARPAKRADQSLGERWVGFLRGYSPVNRVEGMFAESLPKHAQAYGFEPIQFEHPYLQKLLGALAPAEGRLTNVILTGTAGDGKTTLCHDLWQRFGGGDERATGKNRHSYLPLDVDTPNGTRRIHFIFEFSGWCPAPDQEWSEEKLDLINRFARSVQEPDPQEYFILAANDGRLVQAFDSLPEGTYAKSLASDIEELLNNGRAKAEGLALEFLNLSQMSSADTLKRAFVAVLGRPEWSCLVDEADDPAFSDASPLKRNYWALCNPAIQERVIALAELLDANSLHVSIREILLLVVNALLGCESAKEHVATAADLRGVAERGGMHEATIYGNIFGANLSERRRENFAVFRYLGGFRIGFETSNLFDNLLVFGRDDPNLQADHAAYVADDPFYGDDPAFEVLRASYLEAEDDRDEGAEPFLKELVGQRRRLFFRLPDVDDRLDAWKLSIFPSASAYRRQVLTPLRDGRPIETIILQRLICGLNRIWTGMLAGDLDRLFLSTGLDLSSAKVSDIFLYEIPLRRSLHGDEVSVVAVDGAPVLRIMLGRDEKPLDFPLWLVRYEFLTRVAAGALPSSFSKECNEDVLAFKSQVLSQFYRRAGDNPGSLSILSAGPNGSLSSRQLGISL